MYMRVSKTNKGVILSGCLCIDPKLRHILLVNEHSVG